MMPMCRALSRSHHPLLQKSQRHISHLPSQRLPLNLSLYFVADRSAVQTEKEFFTKIQAAAEGGVTCVQYRDRRDPTAFKAMMTATAVILKRILKHYNIPLFINTRTPLETMDAAQADGVYLEDPILSSLDTRKLLGDRCVIGVPFITRAQALSPAETLSFDYFSVKVAPSKQTNPGDGSNNDVWNMAAVKKFRLQRSIVIIGGITPENAGSYYRQLRPRDGIAVAGALMRSNDPCATAQKILSLRARALEKKF